MDLQSIINIFKRWYNDQLQPTRDVLDNEMAEGYPLLFGQFKLNDL